MFSYNFDCKCANVQMCRCANVQMCNYEDLDVYESVNLYICKFAHFHIFTSAMDSFSGFNR